MNQNRITPERVFHLDPGQVFVFGSNLAGRHGAGAALLARQRFGAVTGRGTGLMGRCYGIATKDRHLNTLPLEAIGTGISLFQGFAMASPEVNYLVTEIGCGLAGYSPEQIAPLFFLSDYVTKPEQIPVNISLPARFWAVFRK